MWKRWFLTCSVWCWILYWLFNSCNLLLSWTSSWLAAWSCCVSRAFCDANSSTSTFFSRSLCRTDDSYQSEKKNRISNRYMLAKIFNKSNVCEWFFEEEKTTDEKKKVGGWRQREIELVWEWVIMSLKQSVFEKSPDFWHNLMGISVFSKIKFQKYPFQNKQFPKKSRKKIF